MKKSKNVKGIVIILIIALIILSVILFKKPAVTGKVIQGKEAIYSENLNIQKNESGIYEWEIKNPGSIKSLKATGSVSSNGTAKVYIEKNGTRQLIFDSTRQLFDVDIHVLPEYKKIFQGDKILIQNVLFNLRGFGSANINVKYSIKDGKGNLIATDEETVFVETQAKFVRELIMPPEIKPGTYLAFVEAYTNSTILGSGSDSFEVMSKYAYKYPLQLKYYIIGLAALIGAAIIFILTMQGMARLKKKQKISELKEGVPEEKIQKLENELKAVEGAYKSKFISEESYKKDKKRINDELRKLRK